MTQLSPRYVALAGFTLCFSALAAALYLQYVGGLEPCPLCTFQRLGYASAGLFFALAMLHNPKKIGRAIYTLLIGAATLWGGVVAGRHVWLQNLPADQVPECGPGLDYMLSVFPLQDVLAMVFSGSGECADIDWHFLGFTLPELALLGFLAVFATALIWAFWPRRPHNILLHH